MKYLDTVRNQIFMILSCIFFSIALLFFHLNNNLNDKLNFYKENIQVLEVEINNHELLLQTLHERKKICERETRKVLGSYGDFQYCIKYLKWLDQNPYYDFDVKVPISNSK